MKKQISILATLFLLMLGATAFANGAETNPTVVASQEIATLSSPAIQAEEEAIHCRITYNGIVIECWLCNCAKLYHAVTSPQPQP